MTWKRREIGCKLVLFTNYRKSRTGFPLLTKVVFLNDFVRYSALFRPKHFHSEPTTLNQVVWPFGIEAANSKGLENSGLRSRKNMKSTENSVNERVG